MNTVREKTMIKKLEMAEIFNIEVVNGVKRVSRWGFFANQGDGTYAIYRPETPVCSVDEFFMIEEDGPGAIDIITKNELNDFLAQIKDEIQGIAGMEVSRFTPCGWYYDTIV